MGAACRPPNSHPPAPPPPPAADTGGTARTGVLSDAAHSARRTAPRQTSTRSRRIPGPATLHAIVSCPGCHRATIAAAGSAEPLTPAQRDRALCDAVFIGDLASDALTRPTSGIPAALRRKVMVRDRFACVVPGCRSRHNLEVHHIVHRTDGGDHTMSNLSVWCFLCRARHKWHYAAYPVMPRRVASPTRTAEVYAA